MTNVNTHYRTDIEGLRAIAILFVVAAHVEFPWFSGGFVGVDVFFVMSGYLITSLLLKEYQLSGKVNFFGFYAARLRRLLPALLFMLLATSVAAVYLLSPFEQGVQAKTAGYASVWLSNMQFSLEELDYFAPIATENMYLHTWSLGVEEQFYLIWPVLILLFLGAWSGEGRQPRFNWLVIMMAGVVVVFFTLSVYLSYSQPAFGFYLMSSRAWQFALGALVLLCAVLSRDKVVSLDKLTWSAKTSFLLHAGGWVGLIGITSSAIFMHSNMTYPGFWALFPSIGTALILVAGAGKTRTMLTMLLSIKPLQWIGRVSYSWYLWHWSILVLGEKIFQYDGLIEKCVLVLVALLLAVFSYFAVESPIRKSRYLIERPVFTMILASCLMILSFCLTLFWASSAKEWVNQPEQRIFSKVHADKPITYSMGCDQWYHSAELKFCIFGDVEAEHVAILIGDSIGAQWSPALAQRYVKTNWKFIVITKSSCPMIDEPFFYKRIGREYTECSEWRHTAVQWMKDNKPDIVFMGSAATGFKKNQWIGGTTRILDEIASSVASIYILRSTPTVPFDGPACLSRKEWQQQGLPSWLPINTTCDSILDDPYADKVYQWLEESAQNFDNVKVLNMNPIVCPENRCAAIQSGRAVFRDNMHLSKSYVWSIADKLFDEMRSKQR